MQYYYHPLGGSSSAANRRSSIFHERGLFSSCCRLLHMNNKRISRSSHHHHDDDVIIVGAGVAGSALAFTLAKDGRRVHLIERNLNQPNTVAGELLQPAGYLKLLELGLADCLGDIEAQVVHGYAVCKDETSSVILPYPCRHRNHILERNYLTGRTFRHGHFVRKLREKAQSHTNVKLEQGTVKALIEEGGVIKGVRYKTNNGQESTLHAPLTVICDGYFSSFRKFLAKPKVHKFSNLIGLILENISVPHPGYAHLIMGNPTLFAMYQLSSTEVRIFVDNAGTNLPSISNGDMSCFLKTKVAPQLPKALHSAFITSVEKGDVRTMPITCMPASPNLAVRGALLLGDSLNIRHAMSGGGMTVALQDISLLRNLFKDLNLEDTDKVTKATQRFYSVRKQKAFTLNVLANSICKVMYKVPEELRNDAFEACFNYLRLGFGFPQGLIGLISGLDQRPSTLLQQMVAVATYASGSSIFLPAVPPSPERVYSVARFALDATADVIDLLLDEGVNLNDLLTAHVIDLL